jgi:uncharacterized glyoxalase superfamily protein PhnB
MCKKALTFTENILNLRQYLMRADDVYKKLVKDDLNILAPLETNEYGQRHFIISDPDNILVDIITMV